MPNPPTDRTIKAMRSRVTLWRGTGQKIALVPTMGALHAGHVSLIREAKKRAKRVLVSIFVNPTQFGPNEDFAAYPRDEETDMAILSELGVDAVFAPATEEMYASDAATTVVVTGPGAGLESGSRPHFFGGVATVVAKLFQIVQPDIAVFGQKDYQQLLVIRRMVVDLMFRIEIIGCPVVREADGLAMSSRNAYLSEAERRTAPKLHRELSSAAAAILGGTKVTKAVDLARSGLATAGFMVDYVEARNAVTLEPLRGDPEEPIRVLGAAWLGKTRLIDNVPV